MAGRDFSPYLTWDLEKLLEQLARVQAEIADLSVDVLAVAKGAELDDKARGWAASVESTVRGREKASSFNAVAATQTRFETEALLDALREEKDFLITLIGVRRG